MSEFHFLIVNTQPQTIVQLQESCYSVGRDPTNEIVFASSTISRHHAQLRRQPHPETLDDQYELIDGNDQGKSSHNGTFVNHQRSKSHRLTHGDTLSFGGTIEALYWVAQEELSPAALSELATFETPPYPVELQPYERTTIML